MSNKSVRVCSFLTAFALISPIPVAEAAEKMYATQTVAPSGWANHSRTFYEDGTLGFSDSKIIYLAPFTEMNIWEEEFKPVSQWTDGKTSNILKFNGKKYEILLTAPSRNDIASSFGAATSDTNAYVTIDVPDGKFAGVSFLGGTDKVSFSRKGAIRFNFVDGSSGDWIEYENPSLFAEDSKALAVVARKVSASGLGDESGKIYLHTIDVLQNEEDSEKEVASIDIAARNAYLQNGELTLRSSSKYAEAYYYNARFIGMSMLTDKAKDEEEKAEKIRTIISGMPAADEDFEFSEENIKKLYKIKEIYDDIDKVYITSEADLNTLDAAEDYIALIAKVKVIENNQKIDELEEMMEELPEITELTLSEENKKQIESMKEKYAEIDLKVETDSERKAILEKYGRYIEKYTELLTEKNDAIVAELKKLCDGLAELSEFSKYETYTEETVSTLYEIEALLKTVDESFKITDFESYDLAKEYASKIDVFKKMENDENIKIISDLMTDLPQSGKMEYTMKNEKIIAKISKTVAKLYEDLLSEEQKTVKKDAESYIKHLSKFPPVSVTVNPSDFANMDTVYRSGSSGMANSSSHNYFIDGAEFMDMDVWREDWIVNEHMADNTLVFNGIAYKVRVAEGDYAIQSGYCAKADTKVGYDIFDIEDGLYRGVSFLGGTNVNGSAAAVAFNYEDGTSSKFIQTSISKIYDESSSALAVPGGKYSSSGGNVWGDKVYLYQYTLNNPNPEKKVVSISIPFRNAIISNGELTCGPTSGGTAYKYWGRWLGITLLQSSTEFEEAISKKFFELQNVSDDDMPTKIKEIDAVVKNAEIDGIDVSQIDGYNIYEEKGKSYARIWGYERTSDLKNAKVNVKFACDVSIQKSDLKLTDEDGNDIDFDFAYSDKIAKITFANDLDYEKEYILKISGNVSALSGGRLLGNAVEYKFNIAECVGFSKFETTEIDGGIEVSYVFENHLLDTTDVLIIVCVFDEDGKMFDSVATKGKNLASGESVKLENYTLSRPESYSMEVFCWDNLQGLNTIYKYN